MVFVNVKPTIFEIWQMSHADPYCPKIHWFLAFREFFYLLQLVLNAVRHFLALTWNLYLAFESCSQHFRKAGKTFSKDAEMFKTCPETNGRFLAPSYLPLLFLPNACLPKQLKTFFAKQHFFDEVRRVVNKSIALSWGQKTRQNESWSNVRKLNISRLFFTPKSPESSVPNRNMMMKRRRRVFWKAAATFFWCHKRGRNLSHKVIEPQLMLIHKIWRKNRSSRLHTVP